MALENCLRVSTPRPHCLPPLFSTSREKLVFSAQKLGFKKSVLNSTLSLPSGVANRKSRFICNAREAVNEAAQVVGDSNWDELVLGSKIPVLVDFWAPWCGPCRIIAPIIDELAKDYAGKIACYKLNTDESPNTATKYGIRSIPTVLFFKNGDKLESVIGAVDKSTLISKVEKYIA
ncbi:thioredoxin-like isoform X1 [Trifolium pratense]|uniref:thioredoxin-like isoform X1 n=1 Tax=Trifolium pratense TaxID=57577 RepID=UPI001E694BE8|nr:thioredoxin-like isoform X1 [Trifolium pratense]